MWLVSSYSASNLFSLRLSSSTSSGGKSHLIPTFYAVKMALIDASFRWDGQGEEDFHWIRPLKIAFKLPQSVIVNNSFVRTLKESRESEKSYQTTVGLRQYVFWEGLLFIALETSDLLLYEKERLQRLVTFINYFGKRGSFVQYQKQWEEAELPEHFSLELSELQSNQQDLHRVIEQGMVIQMMDDMGTTSSFDAFDSYSAARQKVHNDRIFKPIVLKGFKGVSSHGYTSYQGFSSS
ncbi:hypothetical protein [Heliorestis convoluta]|uniref:Uncharacterized protein n=1 Tax=Heliorestis convoluta TaxID=356322 RepID=A0A5Q2N6I2_9FIRM|nr:hypothetical protein [Heliorestis convoluta]QGG48982.1 hypothetical protein FTV88_2893 [Heliorestis convoluta]